MPSRAKPAIELFTGENDPREPFLDLIASWMLSLEAAGKSPNTRRLYRLCAAQLLAFLHEQGMPLRVSSLSREHVESFIVAQQRAHPGNGTATTKYNSLRAFFSWLLEEGEITAHPMAKMHAPQFTEKEIPVMSDKLVAQLLNSCKGVSFDDRRDFAILRIFADTPLRRAEVANLRTSDVDLVERMLHVHVKGNRQRTVPIGVKSAQAIDRYKRIRGQHRFASSDRFFLGERGPLSPDALYVVLRKRAKAAGIEGFHPHLFRHLFAHGWLEAGGQEADLMRLGGWRSSEIMRHYAESLAEKRATDAYRRLSPGDRF